LLRRDCRIWIYTTSFRAPQSLRGWLGAHGIAIEGAVNQDRHDRVVGRQGPSKYPPAFGIDLHVDDSPGVALEGSRHRFDVVVVEADDLNWAARVLKAVDARLASTVSKGPGSPAPGLPPRAVHTPRPPASE